MKTDSRTDTCQHENANWHIDILSIAFSFKIFEIPSEIGRTSIKFLKQKQCARKRPPKHNFRQILYPQNSVQIYDLGDFFVVEATTSHQIE